MNIVLDLAVIAVIILSVISGIKKGFVKTILGLVTVLLSAAIAYTLCTPLAGALNGTGIEAGIESGTSSVVGTVVDSSIGEQTKGQDNQSILSSIDFKDVADKINSTFKNANVDAKKLEEKAARAQDNTPNGIKGVIKKAVMDKVVPPVKDFVCKALCFTAIFILAVFAIKIIANLLDLFAKLPVLNLANKVLGAGIGAVYGVARVFILCIIINAFAYLLNISWLTPDVCESTFLFSFFANFNPLSLF